MQGNQGPQGIQGFNGSYYDVAQFEGAEPLTLTSVQQNILFIDNKLNGSFYSSGKIQNNNITLEKKGLYIVDVDIFCHTPNSAQTISYSLNAPSPSNNKIGLEIALFSGDMELPGSRFYTTFLNLGQAKVFYYYKNLVENTEIVVKIATVSPGIIQTVELNHLNCRVLLLRTST